jgi:hypothetical protein
MHDADGNGMQAAVSRSRARGLPSKFKGRFAHGFLRLMISCVACNIPAVPERNKMDIGCQGMAISNTMPNR